MMFCVLVCMKRRSSKDQNSISSDVDLHYVTTSPLLYFFLGWLYSLWVWLCLFLSFSLFSFTPFLSPSLLSVRKSKLVQRRRNTCPSAQDISRALQSPSSTPSASAASLDELIQRCLNCFGQSLCCTCSQTLSCVYAWSQPGYINEVQWRVNPVWEKLAEEEGVRETKGSLIQSSFVLLDYRGQLAIPMPCYTIQISLLTASQWSHSLHWALYPNPPKNHMEIHYFFTSQKFGNIPCQTDVTTVMELNGFAFVFLVLWRTFSFKVIHENNRQYRKWITRTKDNDVA